MEPRVVLVEPENPLNVGFVARAMRACGAKELAIVTRAWSAVPDEARRTGAAAEAILDRARLVATLDEALAGADAAVAFSRRPSALRQKEFVLPDAPPLPAKTALVFGRESAGLTREETSRCQWLARIPCRDGISLNLGQAVAVALHRFTAPAGAKAVAAKAASRERLDALWAWLEPRLEGAPRFPAERRRRARQLLYRLELDDEDCGSLFALFKAAAK